MTLFTETIFTPMPLTGLTELLNERYLPDYHTILLGGFDEPFYLAPKQGRAAQIQFTRDYFRSALHELAHWCIAGEKRRKRDDFGYWYAPDGRTQEQQDAFFKLEIKPQAIEWALSLLCGVKFDVSVDNLGNAVSGAGEFKQAVYLQLCDYVHNAFPARAEALLQLIYECRMGGDAGTVYSYLRARLHPES
jgi:elongation factor P hydroxylase